MMDLSKSYEFFQPENVDRIHIIGCGSVGSTVAELLARYGLTKFSLYDFDEVEPHNIVNQMFVQSDIGKNKVECVANMITAINPEAEKDIKMFNKGWNGQNLDGYVFLCVDNIDLRREIAQKNKYNAFIKGMFDFRTRLVDAQHYGADWSKPKDKEAFLNSMSFSHDEAKEATPVSACNVELSVATTVRTICAFGVNNFINFVKDKEVKKMILVDGFNFEVFAI